MPLCHISFAWNNFKPWNNADNLNVIVTYGNLFIAGILSIVRYRQCRTAELYMRETAPDDTRLATGLYLMIC
jgi:hypothetical protein